MSNNSKPQVIKEQNKTKVLVYLLLAIGVFALLLIGLAVFYSLAYVPFQEKRVLQKCLSISEATLAQKQEEIDEKIESSLKLKESLEINLEKVKEDFLKNNPEPPKDSYSKEDMQGFAYKYMKDRGGISESSKYRQWKYDQAILSRPLDDLNRKISGLQKDLEIIKTEKEEQDSKCYKLHK